MVGEDDPPDHAGIIICAACKRDIPPKHGRFNIGKLSYHVDCYRARGEGKDTSKPK